MCVIRLCVCLCIRTGVRFTAPTELRMPNNMLFYSSSTIPSAYLRVSRIFRKRIALFIARLRLHITFEDRFTLIHTHIHTKVLPLIRVRARLTGLNAWIMLRKADKTEKSAQRRRGAKASHHCCRNVFFCSYEFMCEWLCAEEELLELNEME